MQLLSDADFGACRPVVPPFRARRLRLWWLNKQETKKSGGGPPRLGYPTELRPGGYEHTHLNNLVVKGAYRGATDPTARSPHRKDAWTFPQNGWAQRAALRGRLH